MIVLAGLLGLGGIWMIRRKNAVQVPA
jgi:hypothetical protein